MSELSIAELDLLFDRDVNIECLGLHYKSMLQRMFECEQEIQNGKLPMSWLDAAANKTIVGRTTFSAYRGLSSLGFDKDARQLIYDIKDRGTANQNYYNV